MRIVLTILFLVSWTASARVLADEGAPSDESAQRAYEEAKALFAAEKYKEAADKFREANRLRPSWKIYFNIAQSEAAAKRHGLALQAFEEYVARAGDDIPVDRQELVMSEIERLRPIVGFVTVTAKHGQGATVTIDDLERGTLPLPGPLMVAAGIDHHVTIEKDGETLLERQVKLSGRQTIQINLDETLAPSAPSPAAEPAAGEPSTKPAPAEPQGPSPKRVIGITGLVVGGALLIAGAVTGGVAMGKHAGLKDDCPDDRCTQPGDEDRADTVHSLALATDILLPTGAVVGTVGIALLVMSRGDHKETAGGRFGITPLLGPEHGGLVLEGRF